MLPAIFFERLFQLVERILAGLTRADEQPSVDLCDPWMQLLIASRHSVVFRALSSNHDRVIAKRPLAPAKGQQERKRAFQMAHAPSLLHDFGDRRYR